MATLAAIVRVVFEVAIVAALPIIALKLAGLVGRRLPPRDFFEVPLVTTLAKLLGIVFGLALLYARYDRRYFDPYTLFIPESPWNLSFWRFLGERANPLNYGIGTLVDNPAGNMDRTTFIVLIGLAAALFLATLVAPFLFWRDGRAGSAVLLGLALAAFVAYLTIYAVCVMLWSLYLLNFWALAVAIVVFQYYRERARRA